MKNFKAIIFLHELFVEISFREKKLYEKTLQNAQCEKEANYQLKYEKIK
jgi:hypothetical protein